MLFVLWMMYSKKRAEGTMISFYETKLIYKSKYLFVDKEEIILYDDILNMAYFKSFSQKINNSGSLRFYTKGFLQGLTFVDIPNFKQTLIEIENIARERCKNVQSIGYIR